MATITTTPPTATRDTLIEVDTVRKAYPKPDGGDLLVLDGVSFGLRRREIVGLLGRSGCGKSTLLRIIAGLDRPTGGTVRFEGQKVDGPARGIAMVFQSFALFPWLDVLENVELGLEAAGVARPERRSRALAAIDLVGLDGFESAYPKELSGGMRQRVGIARALVVEPALLLMDEAFSALDVLTAETLRGDFIDLWTAGRIKTESVLLVTHNIEEAVSFCDRVMVMSANPGRIAAEFAIPIPHPRDRQSAALRELIDQIYASLTRRPEAAAKPVPVIVVPPQASPNRIGGLIEAAARLGTTGKADLPELAAATELDLGDLFTILEAVELLGFGQLKDGDVHLTPAGVAFADAELDRRKVIFAEHMMRAVPFAAHIKRVLEERPEHGAPRERFVGELEDHLHRDDAERMLDIIVGWGRFAELFSYDLTPGLFRL
jgi:NitT/TauT family transport system ATP-binding protein